MGRLKSKETDKTKHESKLAKNISLGLPPTWIRNLDILRSVPFGNDVICDVSLLQPPIPNRLGSKAFKKFRFSFSFLQCLFGSIRIPTNILRSKKLSKIVF